MGLFDMTKDKEDIIPNSTKCMTWQDVKASHEVIDPQVVVNLGDTYSTAILLALGLGVAVMVLCLEYLIKPQKRKFKKA